MCKELITAEDCENAADILRLDGGIFQACDMLYAAANTIRQYDKGISAMKEGVAIRIADLEAKS